MRYLKQLAAGVLATSLSLAAAAQTLVVGDQSYNARAVMEAAGVLDDVPYTLEWKQFSRLRSQHSSDSASAWTLNRFS